MYNCKIGFSSSVLSEDTNSSTSTSSSVSESGSITLPQSLFKSLNLSNDTEIGVLFGAYKSSILFPQANQTNIDFAVDSTLVSATIIGFEDHIIDLEEDVSIMLRLHSEVSS